MLRAAAAERNVGPIGDILERYLTSGSKVLEFASGTGQHCIEFAKRFPHTTWQPSECDPRSLHSVVAHMDNAKLPNVRVPLFVDVSKSLDRWILPEDFRPSEVDVVLNINMIHISSNEAVGGLFKSSGELLKPNGGLLITYGPYAQDGLITPESNVRFDAGLRQQNPEWGLRDVNMLSEMASASGLRLLATHGMPANNHMLVFRKDQ
ncbi:unnamed protein product [Auanema sp. JU1783]|nr:unnamed protein product [Auanema sp. JU1783]